MLQPYASKKPHFIGSAYSEVQGWTEGAIQTAFQCYSRIFKSLWEDYHLDSISGQWDYIEPALFGYAAGKVIEDFSRFYDLANQKIVAQFHEWQTGAGLLYLEKHQPSS